MEKLNKEAQSFCEDCQLGIQIKNCAECLFNVFRRFDKYPPFSGDEKDNGKIGDRNGNRNSDTRAK